ncbi:MAG: SCP2 sterol-binding domain-containing protein [Saprospiraceae bacterium]
MTLQELTAEIAISVQNAPITGKTIKLVLDTGIVYIDLSQAPATVSNEDKDADAVVTTTLETLEKLSNKETNPMMAIISGKVTIAGDMAAALQLQNIL